MPDVDRRPFVRRGDGFKEQLPVDDALGLGVHVRRVVLADVDTNNFSGGDEGLAARIVATREVDKATASSLTRATVVGVWDGVSGQLVVGGECVVQHTSTVGLSEADPVYLALDSEDGGTAQGKVTGQMPSGSGEAVTPMGVVIDAATPGGGALTILLLISVPTVVP